MRTFTMSLVAILTMGAVGLSAGNVLAGCGGGGKFSVGFHGGGIKISHGHFKHLNHYPHHKVYVKKVYTPAVVYNKCYHPYYSTCFVYPGDTWYTISRRCYGHSHLWKQIATYNGLAFRAPLVAGTQLQLPVVNGNGTLAASTAPPSAPFTAQGLPTGAEAGSIAPQGQPAAPTGQQFAPQGQQTAPQSPTNAPANVSGDRSVSSPNSDSTPAIPAANIRVAADEPQEKPRPTVMIGSTLMLEGQLLGEEKGIVRLRISGMALPVEILEWTVSSAKIRLPEMDLARAMKAEIEVLRADGSLASKSAVELSPAATRLALGN